MRKINLVLCLVVATFVFTGCSKNSSTALDNSGSDSKGIITKDTESKEVVSPTDIAMTDFFLPDGSKAHYQGDGNEFAELDIEVAHPFENYVIIYENNGGALVRTIYKIDRDEIVIIDNQMVESKTDFPSQKELDAMTPTGIYLKKPFTKGTSFGDWTIIDTDVNVETPYQNFDHAIVIEKQDKDVINRKYFVKGFGEVKRESIMTTDDGSKYIVTSTLKAVDQ
ncbi:hypothetical protein [Sporosarcina sp. YIM B06819]|uniref:hypothetical protein n=1 Tax=Sporosarcina sp. YIM B06819 TaxID=3081769 RepID=UPI00298D3976|nr:hypothetical protein [Sporosarcina sp. YIM B06819]